MASLQTILTAWKTNQQIVSVSLSNGQIVTGQIADDGAGGDTVQFVHKNGNKTYVAKVQIATIPDPVDITAVIQPGKGTNQYRLV